MTHTGEYGEPWRYERERRLMTDADGETVCADCIAFATGPRSPDAESISFRIYTCVNALAGIPSEQIERDATLYPHVREMKKRLWEFRDFILEEYGLPNTQSHDEGHIIERDGRKIWTKLHETLGKLGDDQ